MISVIIKTITTLKTSLNDSFENSVSFLKTEPLAKTIMSPAISPGINANAHIPVTLNNTIPIKYPILIKR